MDFGKNLQFLRKMYNGMTQEELAEKLGVSRQTVSKWESGGAYPEINKLTELCELFSCTMDQLIREDMGTRDEAYFDLRFETYPEFKALRYAVISCEPEEDAIGKVRTWAGFYGCTEPKIIGWDFPVVTQEQINVFHMHGYAAAWVLPEGLDLGDCPSEPMYQKAQKYAVISIRQPERSPFTLIPGAYKTLDSFMNMNGVHHKESEEILPCFEREYDRNGIHYMDVYIAAE